MDYALLGKCSTEVPWDGSDFSTWHQSSTLINFRLCFPPGHALSCTQTSKFSFFFYFKAYTNVALVLTCTSNSTDEGPGPKHLENNSIENTALLLLLYFFFTLLTHLDVRAAKTNCGLCSWHPMKTPNADDNSCLLLRQYYILFNKNSQWVLSWFLFFCSFILLYFYHTIIYFGMFSFSNHFAYWRL